MHIAEIFAKNFIIFGLKEPIAKIIRSTVKSDGFMPNMVAGGMSAAIHLAFLYPFTMIHFRRQMDVGVATREFPTTMDCFNKIY